MENVLVSFDFGNRFSFLRVYLYFGDRPLCPYAAGAKVVGVVTTALVKIRKMLYRLSSLSKELMWKPQLQGYSRFDQHD